MSYSSTNPPNPTATFMAWPYPFDDTNYYELPVVFSEPATPNNTALGTWDNPDTYKDFSLAVNVDVDHCDFVANSTSGAGTDETATGTLTCPGYPDVECLTVPFGPQPVPHGLNTERFEYEGVKNIPHGYCDFGNTT